MTILGSGMHDVWFSHVHSTFHMYILLLMCGMLWLSCSSQAVVVGLPTYGFHMYIQLLLTARPDIALNNLPHVSGWFCQF